MCVRAGHGDEGRYRAGMGEEMVTCRYVFTTTEFKRAIGCYYWHAKWIWWLGAGLGVVIVVGLLQSVGLIMTDKPPTTWDIANNLGAMAFFIIFMALLFKYSGSWAFRRMPSYNQDMQYRFNAEGIHLKTALFEISVFWAAVPRVVESKWGFMLLLKGKRSFHWLPKSGFPDGGAIDAFRILLRQHVPDTTKLLGAEAGQAGG